MKITIRDSHGRQYDLKLEAEDAISTVKLALQEKTGIPLDQQRLIYLGEVLSSGTLKHYSISNGSVLHVLRKHYDPLLEFQRRPPGYSLLESQRMPPSLSSQPQNIHTSESVDVDQQFDKFNYASPRGAASSSTGNHTLPHNDVDQTFDEDEYIIDPQAHFKKLKELERDIVECSQFYKYEGKYPSSETHMLTRDEINDMRNIPDHLGIYLGKISWDSFPSDFRTTVSDTDKVLEKEWQKYQRILAQLRRSYLTIYRVLEIIYSLKASKFCTSYFSVLRIHPGTDVAEIVKLRASRIEDIKSDLESLIGLTMDEIELGKYRSFSGRPLVQSCLRFLEDVGVSIPSSLFRGSGELPSVIKLCRMIAIFLDLALISYVGSHGTPFCAKYLGQHSQVVEVHGDSDAEFSFRCSMQPLACLHGFLDQKKVWVFQIDAGRQLGNRPRTRAPANLSILARIDDFADIWGPVWTIPAEGGGAQIKQHNVSKGVICRVRAAKDQYGAVQCHWYSWASYHRRRASSFLSRSEDLLLAKDDLLLIGAAFRVNHSCRYTLDDYETEYGGNMGLLGTNPSYWKADSRGISLSLSKIVGVTVTGSQKLIPQTTVKQHILDKWTNNAVRANPGVLNQCLGVEISNCTGNARRISLKNLLLLDTVRPLLERQIPFWTRTPWGSSFLAALHNTNPQAIYGVWRDFTNARDRMAELVCCVLEILNTTGRGRDHFHAGFLHNGQESSVSLDYGMNDWAEVLEDSHLSSVYAIINDVCLECRLPNHSAMTCTNSDAYTVLQTQLRVDAADKDPEYDRISVSPSRKVFQRADAGSDRVSLFKPVSRTFFTLARFSAPKALEVREQCDSHMDFYLRASSRSYHGRKLPRRHSPAPAARVVAPQEARNEPERAAVRNLRRERQPALPQNHAPPAVARGHGDRYRRPIRRARRRAHSPGGRGEEFARDIDVAAPLNNVLHDIRNYAIEDGIEDAAYVDEDVCADHWDRGRNRRWPQMGDAALGHRDYARQVR